MTGLTCSFTDFLVNEISLSGQVLHLHDIGIPPELEQPDEVPVAAVLSPHKGSNTLSASADTAASEKEEGGDTTCKDDLSASLPDELQFEDHPDWNTSTTVGLQKHFSDETIIALRKLFDEGRNPPPRQDSGWASRQKQRTEQVNEEEQAMNLATDAQPSQGRGRGNGRSGGTGPSSNPFKAKDSREVVTQVRVFCTRQLT